jgi:O-antigen/teichoic acid export membrane protein
MFQSLYFIPGNFILARGRTSRIAIVTLISGAINLTLILLLTPGYGVIAAAWATFLSYLVMLLLAWAFGQRAFEVPYEYGRLLKLAVVGGALFAVGTFAASDASAIRPFIRFGLWALFPGSLIAIGFLGHDELAVLRGAVGRLRPSAARRRD